MILEILFIALLLSLALNDLKCRRLPNAIVLALACLGIYQVWVRDEIALAVSAGFVGFAIFYLTKVSFKKFRGVDGLGMGDVKLMGAVGLWVGFSGLPWVLFIGSFLTLLYAMLLKLLDRPLTSETRLPFGAFLCIALALVYFCH